MLNISQFLQDYDAATQDVVSGNYRTYVPNMQRWFYVVEQENPLGPILGDLENTLDAKRWLDEAMSAPPKGIGGGLLKFSPDRMSHQLFLCRFLSENDLNVHKIGLGLVARQWLKHFLIYIIDGFHLGFQYLFAADVRPTLSEPEKSYRTVRRAVS